MIELLFFSFYCIIMLGLVVLGAAMIGFWIYTIINALQKTDWKDDNEKTLWIIILFVVGLPASVAYYVMFMRK